MLVTQPAAKYMVFETYDDYLHAFKYAFMVGSGNGPLRFGDLIAVLQET